MRSPLQDGSMARRSQSLVMWYYFTQLTLADSRPFPDTECVPCSIIRATVCAERGVTEAPPSTRSAARAEESGPQVARVVERQLRWFWRFVTMPVLFGLVGATVNFAVVDRAIISRACAIILAGMRALCRCPA